MVALWVEHGIHPDEVLAADPDVQDALEGYLIARAERHASRGLAGPESRELTDAEMFARVLEAEQAMS